MDEKEKIIEPQEEAKDASDEKDDLKHNGAENTSDLKTEEEENASDLKKDEEEDAKEKSPKKSRKPKKPDKKDEQIKDLNDRLLRNMAEFDNYRKRTEKEKNSMFTGGQASMLLNILPVVDDMERGLMALTEEEKTHSLGQGMEMIYKKLIKVLEDAGVTPIEAEGKPFDPAFHNAVMQQQSPDHQSGTVIKELQKGYMFKDQILRHSMVMVAE